MRGLNPAQVLYLRHLTNPGLPGELMAYVGCPHWAQLERDGRVVTTQACAEHGGEGLCGHATPAGREALRCHEALQRWGVQA